MRCRPLCRLGGPSQAGLKVMLIGATTDVWRATSPPRVRPEPPHSRGRVLWPLAAGVANHTSSGIGPARSRASGRHRVAATAAVSPPPAQAASGAPVRATQAAEACVIPARSDMASTYMAWHSLRRQRPSAPTVGRSVMRLWSAQPSRGPPEGPSPPCRRCEARGPSRRGPLSRRPGCFGYRGFSPLRRAPPARGRRRSLPEDRTRPRSLEPRTG